jgi:UDP:flavonoid glycosyltransferase YjiC (YdhE family)
MGTVVPDEMALPVLQATLDALADSPVNVLVTLPRAEDQVWSQAAPAGREALRVPPNAVVLPFTRHAAVMPYTSVFVTHAGLGSVGAALTHGVPMVCLPVFIEQPENAAQVARLGAGRVLPKDAPPGAIREAVEAVLADKRYRNAALTVAREIRELENGAAAIRVMEQIGGGS